MTEKKLILGIDVGTTSVKVCILDGNENVIVAKQSKDTQANVPSELGVEGHKQDPPKIMSALHSCVSRLPKDLLKQVKIVGICGQMHGVMLWQSNGAWSWPDQSRYDTNRAHMSSLYTWQDSRCDSDFLASLPPPKSHLKAHSGYGCNTLFWISRNRPEKFGKFNCAGTIQDFAVSVLCNLERPIMSVQIAASWGYFDTCEKTWNYEVLEEGGFPVALLPGVVDSGEVAGTLVTAWHGIPEGTLVVAALGDLQCSVDSALLCPTDAVLNISTSAQIAFVASEIQSSVSTDGHQVEFLPYFDGKYLAVAAALNGGNVLATFISMLQHWTLELGFSAPQSTLWQKCIEAGSSESAESSLLVIPTLLGERYRPESKASVLNIDLGNTSLGQVFRAICSGIIDNLSRMMPRQMLLDNGIERVVGCGSALTRNKVLQNEVLSLYRMETVFESRGDAAWGAALAAMRYDPSAYFI